MKEYDPKTGAGGVKRTEYAFDNLDPVVEYFIWNGQREEFYRGGVEAFSPTPMLLVMRHFPAGAEGQAYWYHLDGRGSVAGITQHQGQSTHNYRYDAYGQVLPAEGNWTDPHNHYTFAGKEWDEHLGLYEFGVRLYDPWAGVWLTREPLPAQAREPRTWHRYQYAFANPISYYDPYGMQVPNGNVLITFRNLPVETLLRYQQDQGPTNYCASYAISTALNLLFGLNTTGRDVVEAIRAQQYFLFGFPAFDDSLASLFPPQRWPFYSWLPDGGAVTPVQQMRVVNEIGLRILAEHGVPYWEEIGGYQVFRPPIQAEAQLLSVDELIQTLQNPNQIVLFTYSTDPQNPFGGHAVTFVAYQRIGEKEEFGFLNSGWERRENSLTWKSRTELERYINEYPTFFIRPHFVVITRLEGQAGP